MYTLFMDTLLDTVRGEIAACIEKAYLCISYAEAARRLNLASQQAVLEYGKKVCIQKMKWFKIAKNTATVLLLTDW